GSLCAKYYLRGTACTTAHAFSVRDAWGNLLEEQGVLQADPRKARAPLEGQSRSSVLGEWERARDGPLRSGPRERCPSQRDPPLGEREEVDPAGGPQGRGAEGRCESRGG